MKYLVAVFSAVLLMACGQKEEKKEAAGKQPFFVFDQVDYYHKELTRSQFDSILANPNKSNKDLGLLQIVQQNIPVSTIDTLFIPNMDILKFEKKTLPESTHEKLNDLFSVKIENATPKSVACDPIFEDVLVFRKKSKVIGVAKISFDCDKNYIIGSRYATVGFGQSGEYGELKKVLE